LLQVLFFCKKSTAKVKTKKIFVINYTKTMNDFTIFAKMHIKGEIKKKGE